MYLVLLIMVIAALVISLYTGFRLFTLLERIRHESSKSLELASRLEAAWQQFSAREEEERQRVVDRYDHFESTVRDRVEKFEKVATGTRERLIELEQYLKQFFEVELKTVFDSFDKTVASILGEMKTELLRGVDRIEEIQAVVDSKSFAQDRILDGEGSVYKLLAGTTQRADESQGAVSTPEQPEAAAPSDEDKQDGTDQDEKPSMRLKGDEAE